MRAAVFVARQEAAQASGSCPALVLSIADRFPSIRMGVSAGAGGDGSEGPCPFAKSA